MYYRYLVAVFRIIIQIWERWSIQSIPTDMPSDMKEWHLVANRMTFVAFIYWVIIYGAGLLFGLLQLAYHESFSQRVHDMVIYFVPNFLVAAIVISICTYLKLTVAYRLTRKNQYRITYAY